MSTLKADTIQSTSGGAATLTKQIAIKAYAHYDHSNTNIDGSLNISSVADTATGQSTYSFTNSVSLGYAATACGADTDSGAASHTIRSDTGSITVQKTSGYRVLNYIGTTASDDQMLSSMVVGDLA